MLGAIEIGAQLGAKVAGLGAFTGVVGDGGITINERSPIPVTTGNSLTIAAGVQSLFRAAEEMGSIRLPRRRSIIGATGSIGAACAQLIAPKVKRMILRRAQRNAAAQVPRGDRAALAVRERLHDRYRSRGRARRSSC